MHTQRYRIHLEPEPEGGYTVTVPSPRGCVMWGRDFDHALEMAREAVQAYLEGLSKAGETIPEPDAV